MVYYHKLTTLRQTLLGYTWVASVKNLLNKNFILYVLINK